MSGNGDLFERQAPSNDSQAWEDDNFSGLYSATGSSFLATYWNQNILNQSQELVVLFQQENFANGITQGRYTSNEITSNPWVADNFGFSQPKGSTFALVLASYRSGRHLMLYTVNDEKQLWQHEYSINNSNLVSGTIVPEISDSGEYSQWVLNKFSSLLNLNSDWPFRRAAISAYSPCTGQSALVHQGYNARVRPQNTFNSSHSLRHS